MKKLIIIICLVFTTSLTGIEELFADQGWVVKTFSGCDYFIADGPKGLYVLEWYGGWDPDEGDVIVGDIDSYGMHEVIYNDGINGLVWVEDFLESNDQAWDEINDHC